jgi:hypothetical protein
MSPRNPFHSKEMFFDRDHCIAMNIAFAKAMLAARSVGNISFTLGVLFDSRPVFPKWFETPPQSSIMSSPAGALADEGCEESKSREWI